MYEGWFGFVEFKGGIKRFSVFVYSMGEQLKSLLAMADWVLGESISFSWLLDDIEMQRDVRGARSR